MSEVPEGWASVAVRSLYRYWGGMTPSTSNAAYWGGTVPWLSSKDIKASRVAGGPEHITDEALRHTKLKMCRPGSVVVVVRSGVLAHSLPVAVLTAAVTINQDLKAFDSGSDALNEWLALYLRAHSREVLAASRKDGTTVQSIRLDDLLEREVPIPPLSEQKRIVVKVEALLAEVATARDRLEKVSAILKRFRQSVLAAACSGRLTEDWRERRTDPAVSGYSAPEQDWLAGFPELPATWGFSTIGSLSVSTQYGLNTNADASAEAGIPVLRMGNIQDARIDRASLKYVPKEAVPPDFFLAEGDLLFNRTNSPELVGKAAIYSGSTETTFASYLIRVRFDRERVLPEFVCAWLTSGWGRRWAASVRTDGVSQSNINASKLSEMPVPLPPLDEQLEIMARVRAAFDYTDAAAARTTSSAVIQRALSHAVLAKAFRGELVPTEAELARAEGREYESAEQLLARVKAPPPAGEPREVLRLPRKSKRRAAG